MKFFQLARHVFRKNNNGISTGGIPNRFTCGHFSITMFVRKIRSLCWKPSSKSKNNARHNLRKKPIQTIHSARCNFYKNIYNYPTGILVMPVSFVKPMISGAWHATLFFEARLIATIIDQLTRLSIEILAHWIYVDLFKYGWGWYAYLL